MEILRIEDLSFKYPNSDVFALENINISVNRGDFIVICGESGCGKTTLLRLLKKEIAPFGKVDGRIIYSGKEQCQLDNDACGEIGYVFQNPESQIVTDKVWRELAFGLENINTPTEVIRLRVGEMASYFGINDWFRNDTDKLSGGQKQLLNLASVMVMQPKILILDEPTGQLDPIAAADFINTLQKLNRDLGLTIILAEHRLEAVFPIADKIVYMENGKIAAFDKPCNIGAYLKEKKMRKALPSGMRIFEDLGLEGNCPVTVKECRDVLESRFAAADCDIKDRQNNSESVLDIKGLWFRYEKNSEDVLCNVNASLYKGEFLCILGGNGAGKTTLLNVISGLDKPYRGNIKKDKNIRIGYLPQNPVDLFIKDSIKTDLEDFCKETSIESFEISEVCNRLGICNLLDRHPQDLSGGEVQKCALAKVLLTKPDILLLDEPTKGLDAVAKDVVADIINELKSSSVSVVAVSHDLEFAAENADRCGLFFDGELLSVDIPQRFFAENSFYTTAANRIARGLFANAVTCDDVVMNCKKQL